MLQQTDCCIGNSSQTTLKNCRWAQKSTCQKAKREWTITNCPPTCTLDFRLMYFLLCSSIFTWKPWKCLWSTIKKSESVLFIEHFVELSMIWVNSNVVISGSARWTKVSPEKYTKLNCNYHYSLKQIYSGQNYIANMWTLKPLGYWIHVPNNCKIIKLII